jgi:hypothetical protein
MLLLPPVLEVLAQAAEDCNPEYDLNESTMGIES